MADCKKCVSQKVCKYNDGHNLYCKEDHECPHFFEVVRCKDCKFAMELNKHCEINKTAYRHCILLRGDETRNVWHKYLKCYSDYSIVERDGYCSEGERRSDNE